MPVGQEALAREFYVGVLGLTEIAKPAILAPRGGAWFQAGHMPIHLGVEPDIRPAKKAHPAFLVRNLAPLRQLLETSGLPVVPDEPLAGYTRLFTADPFGNRIELLERIAE